MEYRLKKHDKYKLCGGTISIIEGAGNHFDPDIIKILLSIKDEFIAAAKEAV